jgi:hypothetical protein
MKEKDTDEKFFRKIMSKSKLDVPFSDFDDKIMLLIEKRLSKRTLISRDIKISWVFFIIGSCFGIIVTIILPKLQESVLGFPLDKFTIPFLIIFSSLLMTQLDSLIHFYKRQKN